MKIGEAAKTIGLPVKTLRYYDDIGLVSPCERASSGYRQYSKSDLAKLVLVRRARTFGFSIGQTRELLSLYEDRNRSASEVKHIAQRRLREIRGRMRELRRLSSELDHLVKSCDGDDRPECPILSGLSSLPPDR